MATPEQKLDLVMRYVSAEDTNEKIRLRDEIRKALSDTRASTPEVTDISYDNEELMSNIIDDLFKEIGMTSNLLGYSRTAYAIKLVISDDTYIFDITGRLYPDIAKKFNGTSSSVERNIRSIIESTWNRKDLGNAYRIFGNVIDIHTGKPTNSEFIACCADVVKRRMRDAM